MIDEIKPRVIFATIVVICAACGMAVPKAGATEFPNHESQLTETITPNGFVDWTNGMMTATGVGFPPKDLPINSDHANAMAKRAAESVALRNLLEVFQGVRVDSTTTVRNYMVANDEIHVRVDGIIRGAKVLKNVPIKDDRGMATGGFEATVTLSLKGDLSKIIIPKPTTKPAKSPPTGVPQAAIKAKTYTGLVVDARGLGAQPALAPKILNEEGQEAYSVAYVEKSQLIDDGIVVYVPDLPAAEEHPRVTKQPLIVKAVRTAADSKADLVISNADAQTIHGVPDHYRFLQKAQVLVVLDKSQ